MYVLSDFIKHKDLLITKAEKIRTDLDDIYKTESILFKGRFNKTDITKRIELVSAYFEKVVKE